MEFEELKKSKWSTNLYISSNGEIFSKINKVLYKLKPYKEKNGYYRIGRWHDGRLRKQSVHRLIAKAFIPNPKKYKYVNHKNGIKTDNRVSNLEWVSPLGNAQHAVILGLYKRGQYNGKAKISLAQAYFIKFIATELPRKYLAEKFGINLTAIQKIQTNKTWKHLTKESV